MFDGYVYSNEGKCDICKKCANELLILRSERFTKRSPKEWKENVHRVCWWCGIELNFNGEYEFGDYWKEILLHYKFLSTRRGFDKGYDKVRKEVMNR
ncbi:MAG: hypothetical protein GF317_03580 [Candidatus Lokiarchaeota archaeon]|nr:hypothetical protein [Candidatus Lokiarchaeota archaeon]